MRRTHGSTAADYVTCRDQRDFRLRSHPFAEQKAIAAVLGALDDKIELNRRMNATLEAMARALFQSWFVDFDPVRAKLDGRPPAGLDPATAALFPAHFQDSDARPHPARLARPHARRSRRVLYGSTRLSLFRTRRSSANR